MSAAEKLKLFSETNDDDQNLFDQLLTKKGTELFEGGTNYISGSVDIGSSIVSGSSEYDLDTVTESFDVQKDFKSLESGHEPDEGFYKLVFEKNYSSRVIEVTDKIVRLEVLVDSQSNEFEERVFEKILFEDIPDLEQGSFILLRIFKRPGSMKLMINDGSKFVNRQVFEDYSEFDFLDDISTPEIDLGSI